MKYFGTVKTFDSAKGFGEIKQETGGDDLRFEKSAISWGHENPPTVGQRLSYERGANSERQPRALNRMTIESRGWRLRSPPNPVRRGGPSGRSSTTWCSSSG